MLRLGKLPVKFHRKTLLLNRYLKTVSPAPPAKRSWEYRVPDSVWAQSMLGNDDWGDCVIAAMLHYIMCATANTSSPQTFTTDQALQLYSAITGFDPSAGPSGSNPTDNGTAWTDALAYWQITGVFGHKILGWAAIDPSNVQEMQQAVNIFGAALVGTSVTQSMMDQFNAKEPWNAPFSGANLGGHAIPQFGYGSQGQTYLTWASRQQADTTFPSNFDEAYVVVTQDWIDAATQETPSGFDLPTLEADLKSIATSTSS